MQHPVVMLRQAGGVESYMRTTSGACLTFSQAGPEPQAQTAMKQGFHPVVKLVLVNYHFLTDGYVGRFHCSGLYPVHNEVHACASV